MFLPVSSHHKSNKIFQICIYIRLLHRCIVYALMAAQSVYTESHRQKKNKETERVKK